MLGGLLLSFGSLSGDVRYYFEVNFDRSLLPI
jgi:hypothetical protein